MLAAFDPGYGAVKLAFDGGTVLLPSAVAADGGRTIRAMAGLRARRPPLEVTLPDGQRFFVGEGAHDWGRPVENLDFERLTGSPEMRALFYGALTAAGIEGPLRLMVGLPIEVLSGPDAEAAVRAVKAFLRGPHRWIASGRERAVEVADVGVTGQPVGALFDYFLDDSGAFVPERRADFSKEIGVINIGMNTVDLLAARQGVLVQRMTGGETLGVRRLLSLLNPDGLYTLAELDERLRARQVDLSGALPIWEREVLGFIERQWGKAFRRFARVIAVGGGALLLGPALARRFDRIWIPDDPVMATARGLLKFARKQAQRREA
ncbi:hypothetical protein [Thermoflexus sp.]|uniref:ParM/StbA family protein n=1 Tax=Thermoflexus sp. TaxID=1969742 RepID=UPI0035E4057C